MQHTLGEIPRVTCANLARDPAAVRLCDDHTEKVSYQRGESFDVQNIGRSVRDGYDLQIDIPPS